MMSPPTTSYQWGLLGGMVLGCLLTLTTLLVLPFALRGEVRGGGHWGKEVPMLVATEAVPEAGMGDLLLKVAGGLTVLVILGYHAVGLWGMLTRRNQRNEDEALKTLARKIDEVAEKSDEAKERQTEFVNRAELGRAVRAIHTDHNKLEAYVYDSAKKLTDGQNDIVRQIDLKVHSIEMNIERSRREMGDQIHKEMTPLAIKIDELIRTTARLTALPQWRARGDEHHEGAQ